MSSDENAGKIIKPEAIHPEHNCPSDSIQSRSGVGDKLISHTDHFDPQ